MPTIPPKSLNVAFQKTSLNSNLNIIADEKILHVVQAFSTIGNVVVKSGNDIASPDVAKADVLVTRTTTKVSEKLLENSAIKFVATATAGTDHVNLEYLTAKEIGFTSAPGCNSDAVGEFVVNALLRLAANKKIDLSGKTIGIIGAGNAGSALKRKACCLGLKCLLNDPPLFDKTSRKDLIPINDLVAKSDIISLHVPLTKNGPHPTYHLIDRKIISAIKPNSIFINTSRGGIINECVLVKNRGKFSGIILDVWEGEPHIDPESLKIADFATPHIAGYSLDGKFKATEIVYRETCSYFGLAPTWKSPRQYNSESLIIDLEDKKYSLAEILKRTYDIYEDDKRLREVSTVAHPTSHFRSLRGSYHFRQEFANFQISNYSGLTNATIDSLKCLGFVL